MAEIPIERKPRRSVGPLLFVLILIVLAAACWYWWTNYGNKQKTNITTSTPTSLAHSGNVSISADHSLNLRRL